jgi:hypothetical protein
MLDYKLLRTLLTPFGELRSQCASDWTGADPLPEEIGCFYEQVGPWGSVYNGTVGPVGCTLNVGGNPVRIPPLHKLENLQAGYAWSTSPKNTLQGWDSDWLVIAEQGGDPFIYQKSSGNILFAFHGAGLWKPRFFAKDLITAVGSLAAVANEFVSLEEGDFDNDEPTIGAIKKIKIALATVIEDHEQAEKMLLAWEYYL